MTAFLLLVAFASVAKELKSGSGIFPIAVIISPLALLTSVLVDELVTSDFNLSLIYLSESSADVSASDMLLFIIFFF